MRDIGLMEGGRSVQRRKGSVIDAGISALLLVSPTPRGAEQRGDEVILHVFAFMVVYSFTCLCVCGARP